VHVRHVVVVLRGERGAYEELLVEAADVRQLEFAGELEHRPGRVRHQGRDGGPHVRGLVGGKLVVGEERQPLVAGRRVQRPEDLVEGGPHDRGQLRGRDICCEHRLQRPHAALAHGRVGVLEAGAVGEVDEAPNTWGVVAEHVLDLLERHPFLRDRPVRPELDHRRCVLLAEGVPADCPPDRGLGVAAV
jgi:hypothetical protein